MSREKTSAIWTVSDAELKDLFDECDSVKEILNKLGYRAVTGRTHKDVKHRALSIGVDVEGFMKHSEAVRVRNAKLMNRTSRIPTSDILVNGSSYHRDGLKNRLVKEGLIPYNCSGCGLKDSYNDKPIKLHLDHINGINNDNRLPNLRLLCPNCHSQTPTYCGRNNIRKKTCPDCGGKVSRGPHNKCRKCSKSDIRNSKASYPGNEELEEMLRTTPAEKVAKQLGVSGVALGKYCKRNNIPKPGRGFWSK